MGNTIYLFSAFGITWALLFFYVFSMLRRQKSLETRIDDLNALLEDEDGNVGKC